MSPLVFLLVAVAAGIGAYLVGWPALQGRRSRATRDRNVERYRAWRGHGRPSDAPGPREGMTSDERRRLLAAAGLALVSAASLVAFFVGT